MDRPTGESEQPQNVTKRPLYFVLGICLQHLYAASILRTLQIKSCLETAKHTARRFLGSVLGKFVCCGDYANPGKKLVPLICGRDSATVTLIIAQLRDHSNPGNDMSIRDVKCVAGCCIGTVAGIAMAWA